MHYSKAAARTYFLEQRNSLNAAQIEQWSLDIANQVTSLPLWKSDIFHLFLSIPQKNEVDTEPLLTLLQGKDKSIVCPKMIGPNQLQHFLLTDQTKIEIHSWGIPEPAGGIAIEPDQIDVVFVPLLGFDRQGNRVGYGGGYYDRFLSQCRKDTLRIGLSFFDPLPEISPVEPSDIPLHYAVTPQKVWRFNRD